MNNDSQIDLIERSWLKKHRAGDKTAFRDLMQSYRKPVYSYLKRCGLEKNCCDDLFQDIFFKIHKNSSSYNPKQRLSPWIFTIAVNTVRNYIRDNKTEKTHLSLVDDSSLQLVDESASPEKITQSTQQIQWLEKAVLKLPSIQSQVLNLLLIDGLKLQQVAEILELPVNTVKTHSHRARQSLIQSYAKISQADNVQRSIL